MARQQEYVADVKRAARAIWDGINALEALQAEWDALDYGSTLAPQGDAEPAEVGAVVHATAAALRQLLNDGHATNLARLL